MKVGYYSSHPAGRGPFGSQLAGQEALLLGPHFKAGDPSTAPSPVALTFPQPEPHAHRCPVASFRSTPASICDAL